MLTMLNKDMADDDRKELQALKANLEKQNVEKLKEMDTKQVELEAALLIQKNELD